MNLVEKKFRVEMGCATCAVSIAKALKRYGMKVDGNPALKMIKVQFDSEKYSTEDVIRMIKEVGYEATEK